MNKKINVYLMYCIVFLQGFVFYGPVATLYRQARGLSMYEIFLLESIFLVLMIIFEIPWGVFADRFGYKKTLILSNFLFFVSKIIFYKANSFELFLAERMLLALAFSGISGCDIALLYSSVEENQSQKIFGKYNGFSTLGFLIASFLSSIIVKKSMDKAAVLTIIPYGIALLLTFFLKDIETHLMEKPKFKQSFKTAFKNKNMIWFVLSLAFIREVFQSVNVFLNQLQYVRCGMDIKHFGILVAIIQIVRLSAVKAHELSDKFGKNKSIGFLYMVIITSCFSLIFTDSSIFSVICILFIGTSMALIEPMAVDIQNKAISTGNRATILSIYAMLGDVVGACINLLVGKAADQSVELAFIVCVIISISAYMIFSVYKKNKSENKLES